MSFCSIRRSSGQFNSVLQSFVQGAGLPLRDALSEDLLERVAQEESASFGTGPGDIYSTALVLWAFVTQGISKDKSCAAAVAFLALRGRRANVRSHLPGQRSCNNLGRLCDESSAAQ